MFISDWENTRIDPFGDATLGHDLVLAVAAIGRRLRSFEVSASAFFIFWRKVIEKSSSILINFCTRAASQLLVSRAEIEKLIGAYVADPRNLFDILHELSK